MNEIANIIEQLEQQREAIDRALTALKEIGGTNAPKPFKKLAMQKRHLSPEGRARIAEAMRRRWAATKKGNKQ